ncbi:hypothetical protein AGMMS49960_16890 [Betaproteobacteria bacterium]|nr:hypothetical protein AGMMS49543_00120 [Betaproteobacteria bacterium]GHU03104.1 hypothetical protein AGMMS49960_16890 [Betaproteobacteria bacterium]GHU11363.1 hypothetical protein AGMMS50225_16700 [Betaproteobacteria bacterium]GHU16218.1 hypothetical protein AGMMS50243_01810 [Betaproteobacteria bacterium]
MPEWFWFALIALGLGLLRLLLEFAGHVISEIVTDVILYGTGWCFLRLVTLGRYPPGFGEDKVEWIMVLGFVVLAAVITIAYFIFKSL